MKKIITKDYTEYLYACVVVGLILAFSAQVFGVLTH
jgi:hypothetical protein